MKFKLSNIGKVNRRVELRHTSSGYFNLPEIPTGDLEILDDGQHLNVCLVGLQGPEFQCVGATNSIEFTNSNDFNGTLYVNGVGYPIESGLPLADQIDSYSALSNVISVQTDPHLYFINRTDRVLRIAFVPNEGETLNWTVHSEDENQSAETTSEQVTFCLAPSKLYWVSTPGEMVVGKTYQIEVNFDQPPGQTTSDDASLALDPTVGTIESVDYFSNWIIFNVTPVKSGLFDFRIHVKNGYPTNYYDEITVPEPIVDFGKLLISFKTDGTNKTTYVGLNNGGTVTDVTTTIVNLDTNKAVGNAKDIWNQTLPAGTWGLYTTQAQLGFNTLVSLDLHLYGGAISEIVSWSAEMIRRYYLCGGLLLPNSNMARLHTVPATKPLQATGNLSQFFLNCSALNDPKIVNWNMSGVTGFASFFEGAAGFDQDISSWDVSSANNMSHMFKNALNFNKPLNNWDVSKVTTIEGMFRGAVRFNQPLDAWSVGTIANMSSLFRDASSYNQDLSGWCVPNITAEPFEFATNSALEVSHKPVWGTCPSEVADPAYVFEFTSEAGTFRYAGTAGDKFEYSDGTSQIMDANGYYTAPAGRHKVTLQPSQVGAVRPATLAMAGVRELHNFPSTTDISRFSFYVNSTSYSSNLIRVPEYLPPNITNMENMFRNCSNFGGAGLAAWDVSKVTDMRYAFYGNAFLMADLSDWRPSASTRMDYMFYGCSAFDSNLNAWDVSKVTRMDYMFYGCSSFNRPLSNWKVGAVTNMSNMFRNTTYFNQSLTAWCVTNITSRPSSFSTGSALAVENQPVWGTCPNGV